MLVNTHSRCVFLRSLLDGLFPLVMNRLRRSAKTHTLVVYFCVHSLTVCLLEGCLHLA